MLFDVHQPRHIQADSRRIDGSGDEFKSPLWRNRKTESTRESERAAGPINWAKEGHPLGIKSPGEVSDGDDKEHFSRKRNITWTMVVMAGYKVSKHSLYPQLLSNSQIYLILALLSSDYYSGGEVNGGSEEGG